MPTPEELAEASNRLFTDHRTAMARWLALEILLQDDEVMSDKTLADRLIALQDKLTDENTQAVLG